MTYLTPDHLIPPLSLTIQKHRAPLSLRKRRPIGDVCGGICLNKSQFRNWLTDLLDQREFITDQRQRLHLSTSRVDDAHNDAYDPENVSDDGDDPSQHRNHG